MIPKNISELVTFSPNRFEPIHDWFYYKEGYAKKLVEWLVKEYNLEGPIFDPFCGSGTTVLAAKQMGIESIGCDVSPLAVLASKVKTRNYEVETLKKKLGEFREMKVPPEQLTPRDERLRKIISRGNWEEMHFLKKKIEEIGDEKARDFFYLAMVDSFGAVAQVVKVGGSLRRAKKNVPSMKKFFERKCERMIRDLERGKKGVEPEVIEADARVFNLEENSIGSIITSPPYLNKIEYTTVYKLELILFFKVQETQLRAFIGDEPQNIRGTKIKIKNFQKFPPIAQAYFEDMEKVMVNCFRCLKPKGKMVIVVAGGCLPDRIIQSDEILCDLGQAIGFKIIDIIAAREIFCHANRSIKIGKVRESVIVLEKPEV
ncbi:MAG: DNA methyltransferase [Candidatus Diapherotrites archaeon]|nr:DNA methyltransferase [Candidatus Diapherotrites archaeon]